MTRSGLKIRDLNEQGYRIRKIRPKIDLLSKYRHKIFTKRSGLTSGPQTIETRPF